MQCGRSSSSKPVVSRVLTGIKLLPTGRPSLIEPAVNLTLGIRAKLPDLFPV